MTCLIQAHERTSARREALYLVAVHRVSWLGLGARDEREFGPRVKAKPYARVEDALADMAKAPLSKARANAWPWAVVSA